MKKRNGFCLLPALFGFVLCISIFFVIFGWFLDIFTSPSMVNESFLIFEQKLIDEYGIEYGDVYIDTSTMEIYYVTSENISLEDARKIVELTREYMLVEENYKPFLDYYKTQNFGDPLSVRIRFEPEYSLQYYYQFTAPSFKATSWHFESYIDGEYYNEYYDIFDFVKSTLIKAIC